MPYCSRAYPEPVNSRCCVCGRESAGLWCDGCLTPYIEKGQAFQPEISVRGSLEACAVLARTLVNSGARVNIYSKQGGEP